MDRRTSEAATRRMSLSKSAGRGTFLKFEGIDGTQKAAEHLDLGEY